MASSLPLLCPVYLPGQEPVPPGTTQAEREEMMQAIKYQKMLGYAMESCPLKVVMSGGAGEYSAGRTRAASVTAGSR
jgi:import inner membrane translocase subunit TIM22